MLLSADCLPNKRGNDSIFQVDGNQPVLFAVGFPYTNTCSVIVLLIFIDMNLAHR